MSHVVCSEYLCCFCDTQAKWQLITWVVDAVNAATSRVDLNLVSRHQPINIELKGKYAAIRASELQSITATHHKHQIVKTRNKQKTNNLLSFFETQLITASDVPCDTQENLSVATWAIMFHRMHCPYTSCSMKTKKCKTHSEKNDPNNGNVYMLMRWQYWLTPL